MLSTVLTSIMKEGLDVKALRAFRVLRPLRLVSGVPSKFFISFSLSLHFAEIFITADVFFLSSFSNTKRSPGRSQFNFASHGAFASHRTSRYFRYHNLRNYWAGVVLGQTSPNLL